MEKDERGGMSPDKAGSYIANLAVKRRTRPLKAIGFSYKAVAVLSGAAAVRLLGFTVYPGFLDNAFLRKPFQGIEGIEQTVDA